MHLPKPFDTFRLEKRPGEYKSFHSDNDTSYPIAGVTYPTNYGDISDYTGEDGHPLDVFVGTGDLLAFITVFRPDIPAQIEHKFCVNITSREEAEIHKAFAPVLRQHGRFASMSELLKAMEFFKND